MVVRIFRHFVPISVISLALCETLAIFVVWNYFLLGNELAKLQLYEIVQLPTFWLAVFAGLIMALTGLYHAKVLIDLRIMTSHIAVSLIILCPIVAAGAFWWRHVLEPNVSFLEVCEKAVLSWLGCILITRLIFLRLSASNLLKRRVLVLGGGERASRIAKIAEADHHRTFTPVAFISPVELERCAGSSHSAAGDALDEMTHVVYRHRAQEVVVAADDRRGLPLQQLLQCRLSGIRVTDYLDFIERETKTVDLDALQPGWFIFSDGFRQRGFAKFVKRCFDIVVSTPILLVALPLMLLTALLIVLDSPGPAFYRQERVGLGGCPFILFKFRSMRVDAENGVAQWAATKDPRITLVGRIIRKLRIDELPQLFNVLRGDMSFVGPRPERPVFVEGFARQIPFYVERHCVKPGITGWAQINYPYGACLEDARKKLAYDLYYVKNQGLFLDLVIVLQTLRVVLWADGAR
jgi:sugar transferase (PEP-CTERM system associated)